MQQYPTIYISYTVMFTRHDSSAPIDNAVTCFRSHINSIIHDHMVSKLMIKFVREPA